MADLMHLDELLAVVETVDRFLDSHRSPEYLEQPLANDWARVTKVCEEAGEVWKTLSMRTGENYRKGVCATEDELLGELGDCVSAAMCAIQHRTKDAARTWTVVSAAFAKARDRVAEHTGQVVDVGYLSLPADLQAEIEAGATEPPGASGNPTPDCGYQPRHPPAAIELWWCADCREFHQPKDGPDG